MHQGPVIAPVEPVLVSGLPVAVIALVPIAAILLGVWVYRDARSRGTGEWAPIIGGVVGGLLLAGSLPGLVALAIAEDAALQGFPTALRIVPGLVALGLYVVLRSSRDTPSQ